MFETGSEGYFRISAFNSRANAEEAARRIRRSSSGKDRGHMVIIRPIRNEEVEAAKRVITTVCFEFFGLAPANFEDMNEIESQYSGAAGAFFVLLDDETVVGTGAIRRFDDSTCELKRMWFLEEYRGRGFGKEMAQILLDEARKKGYKKARLDTSPQQEQALGLYRRLGFQFIEPYNNGPATLFLEKQL